MKIGAPTMAVKAPTGKLVPLSKTRDKRSQINKAEPPTKEEMGMR